MSNSYLVCIDCLHVAHYGNEYVETLRHELGEEVGTKRFEEVSNSLEALGGSLYGGDCEVEFSWDNCECCGLDIAGGRYELVSIS